MNFLVIKSSYGSSEVFVIALDLRYHLTILWLLPNPITYSSLIYKHIFLLFYKHIVLLFYILQSTLDIFSFLPWCLSGHCNACGDDLTISGSLNHRNRVSRKPLFHTKYYCVDVLSYKNKIMFGITSISFPSSVLQVLYRAVAALRRQCEKKAEKARRRLKGAKAPPFFQEPF